MLKQGLFKNIKKYFKKVELSYLSDCLVVDLLGTEPTMSKPVINNFGPPDTGGGGLLVDVFEMPATPVAGSAPSITPGAEENIKK